MSPGSAWHGQPLRLPTCPTHTLRRGADPNAGRNAHQRSHRCKKIKKKGRRPRRGRALKSIFERSKAPRGYDPPGPLQPGNPWPMHGGGGGLLGGGSSAHAELTVASIINPASRSTPMRLIRSIPLLYRFGAGPPASGRPSDAGGTQASRQYSPAEATSPDRG
jgi:hypothetical protein